MVKGDGNEDSTVDSCSGSTVFCEALQHKLIRIKKETKLRGNWVLGMIYAAVGNKDKGHQRHPVFIDCKHGRVSRVCLEASGDGRTICYVDRDS